ncbi:type II restriction enzyme [Sporolactobacillus spathodeae]|uniref:Transcriptional regulator n=1 Tax=Sporolactobacillus spathodeae TaxID=1465502 RepID=A0ABS2QBI6_9BACL|nr:hypothetical protein [Sporolactobacillus spathodeae]MBM7658770.1 hypothetical protein [Sporolactobacillus spathodeae]
MTAIDHAWINLFKQFSILNQVNQNGLFQITAAQINANQGLEKRVDARLMAKFDHKSQLPTIFREHDLAILPISRGTYCIGHFKAYADIAYDELIKPTPKTFPETIDSVSPYAITSESVALNLAYASGMVNDVLQTIKGTPCFPAISGRLGSPLMHFVINGSKKKYAAQHLAVAHSQIEIDASYENREQIGIFEAKLHIPKDFLVRQLYYPYTFFKQMKLRKKIVPIYFTYVANIFSFHIFEFTDDLNYSSIKEVRHIDFAFKNTLDITRAEIEQKIRETRPRPEPKEVPFPQADNFLRCLNLISFLSEGEKTREDIAAFFGFDPRQSDYYFNALKYLGYANKDVAGKRILTAKGQQINKIKDLKKGKLMIIEDILQHKVFKTALIKSLEQGEVISKEQAKYLIVQDTGLSVDSDTPNRRASTVRSWINWIENVITI